MDTQHIHTHCVYFYIPYSYRKDFIILPTTWWILMIFHFAPDPLPVWPKLSPWGFLSCPSPPHLQPGLTALGSHLKLVSHFWACAHLAPSARDACASLSLPGEILQLDTSFLDVSSLWPPPPSFAPGNPSLLSSSTALCSYDALLSIYYVLGSIPDTGDRVMNKSKSLSSWGWYSSGRKWNTHT